MSIKENTNRSLATNTTYLYIKLAVTSICSFFTTRFALQALGVVDYGLFSVLGSIVSFIAILNTIMVSTTNRYIAVSLGRGNINDANKYFNVCWSIHLAVALLTALVAFPIGHWYINHYLNYSGDIHNASIVFDITVVASLFSFFTVPYNGLLTAKENFKTVCFPSILASIFRLTIAYLLVNHFEYKLFVYAFSVAITTVYPGIRYIFFCHRHYREIVRMRFVRDRQLYMEILTFSGWVSYGAIAYVGKAQGAAVLINLFFNTVMNTALGIANSVNSIIGMFAKSIVQPIEPQITKSYAAGNKDRSEYLLVLAIKLTFFMTFVIATPFLVDCHWILSLWLGTVPEEAVVFTMLIIIDALVDSLNAGIKSIIFASGNIKLFQIVPSTLKLASIVVAYIVLKMGFEPYSLIIVYICFSAIIVIANQYILKRTISFDNRKIFKKSYIPSLLIVILALPCFVLNVPIQSFARILISLIYVVILIVLVGFTLEERKHLLRYISGLCRKVTGRK